MEYHKANFKISQIHYFDNVSYAHQFNQLGIEWVVLNAVGPFHFIQRLYCSTCYYEL